MVNPSTETAWEVAWDAATPEERRTSRRWDGGDKYRSGLRGDRAQCASCGHLFNSSTAYDRHRAGAIGINRRCMTIPEMIGKGFSRNDAFYWITSTMKGYRAPA